jgi:hypothetical protein
MNAKVLGLPKRILVAVLIAGLLLGGMIAYAFVGPSPSSDTSGRSETSIELQKHKNKKKHKRCKPKGKYGKPPKPRKCRRNP